MVNFLAEDIYNTETGEIFAEAGDEVDEKDNRKFRKQ